MLPDGDATSANAHAVRTGTWTNWSRGPVSGATLTLTRQDGNLLIAFLAFFIGIVGNRLWRILCIVMHLAYSTNAPSDGLHHQRQVLLRNSQSPEASLFILFDLVRGWRRRATRVVLRLLPLLVLAIISLGTFVTAGGFSSRVATLSNSEVLLTGTQCGFLDMSRASDNLDTLMHVQAPVAIKDVISADSYARNCYTSFGGSNFNCDTWIREHVAMPLVDTNASCPFQEGMCQSDDSNLLIDTGYLDSHADFGRNTRPDQRFAYRRVIHCAPLQTLGFTSTFNLSSEESYTRYHYGGTLNTDGGQGSNYTEQFSNDRSFDLAEMMQNHADTDYDYSVRCHFAMRRNGSLLAEQSSFLPMPQLSIQDANLYLFFLTSSAVVFTEKVNDAWYRANRTGGQIYEETLVGGQGNVTTYRQDKPGSPMACMERHQYCFPGVGDEDRRCTPLTSSADLTDPTIYLEDDAKRQEMRWMLNTSVDRMILTMHPISMLGIQVLTSRSSRDGGFQAPLPDNQWQLDVQHWHFTTMAALQARFVSYVLGPSDPRLGPVWRLAETKAEKELCRSQKIRTPDYISFNILGLSVIIGVGGTILVLSYCLQPIVSLLRRRGCISIYAQREWAANEPFQLQRLGQEGAGVGPWSCACRSVPITKSGHRLAVLDLTDPSHPRLVGTSQDQDGGNKALD